jgi:glycosyltransferase involved in cell wall biosynthesis
MSVSGSPLRIHWVSPLPPAKTEIAEYTRRILPFLAARAEVVLWTDAEDWDPELEAYAAVRRFDPFAESPLDLQDLPIPSGGREAVFLHVGNNWMFHTGIIQLARRVPACIVLHDLSLIHCLQGATGHGKLRRTYCVAEALKWYGDEGACAVLSAISGGETKPTIYDDFPMWELGVGRGVSVITHTRAAYQRVRERGGLPAYLLNLPYPAAPSVQSNRALDGPLRLVLFGHIGPNRRLEQILEALGRVLEAEDGRFEFELDVCGNLWNPELYLQLARKYNLLNYVRFRGFVSDAELDNCLSSAHLAFNLRNPTVGEASASQLRIWNAGVFSVVTDVGWYGSLPTTVVAKISPDEEVSDLVELFRRLMVDRRMGAEVGAAGRLHLEAFHDSDDYADGVIEAAGRFADDAARSLLAESAARATRLSVMPHLASGRLDAVSGGSRTMADGPADE